MESKYKVLSLSFASYTSIFLALIPVIYVSNGFSSTEIAFLSSMYTFGAIVQPMFTIATNKIGIKKTLLLNLVVLMTSCLFLFISKNFMVYLVFVTLYYIFQAPNIGLIDNFLKLISEQKKLKFGTLRAFVSAGWGLGTILAIPFMYFFSEKSLIVLIIGLIILTFVTIKKVHIIEPRITEKKLFKWDLLKNSSFRKVLIMSCLIMGIWGIKSSYQTILILSKTSSVYIVSIISVISILMELLIIPRVEGLYNRLGYQKLFSLAAIAGMVLTFGYYFFNSIVVIVVLASLHGVLCGIMIPLNVFKVREIVPNVDFDSAMLLMYSVQNLFAFLLITLIINRVYILINVEVVYLILSFFLAFIVLLNTQMNYSSIQEH